MNKVVLITGVSQGIGEALAYEYARNNFNVVLLSRNEEAIKRIAENINSKNGNANYKKCDVTDLSQIKDAVAFAIEKYGHIDTALLNAGVGNPETMEHFSSEDFKKVVSVNTFGIAHGLECLIPVMKSQGGGIIAGVTSLADIRGYPGSASYCASKAASSVLLESARLGLKKFNISVVTVRPGFVRTEMTAKNEFKMPFLWEPKKAAKFIRRGIERKKSVVQFPLFTVNLTRLVKFLPNWFYDPVLLKLRSGRN